MPREESLSPFPSHIAREDLGARARQVDHHEPIESIAELGIDAEGQELAAQPHILPHQNRNPLAVRFEVGDGSREIFHIRQQRAKGLRFPFLHQIAPEWPSGFDCSAPSLARALSFEVTRNQLSRSGRVLITHTDRADQGSVLRMPRNPRPDSLPQQQQWRKLTLVFGTNERPAQLDRRSQLPYK